MDRGDLRFVAERGGSQMSHFIRICKHYKTTVRKEIDSTNKLQYVVMNINNIFCYSSIGRIMSGRVI